jgi:hypothetical protein
MIAVPQSSLPHPSGFLLSQEWETTVAGYNISGSCLAWLFWFAQKLLCCGRCRKAI